MGTGKICKKCGGRLRQRATKQSPKQLQQPYYYTAYYFCEGCKRLFHDEKFKVTNNVAPNASKVAPFSKQNPRLRPTQPQTLSLLKGEGKEAERFDVEIWTDGACIFNGQENARAAWAFVALHARKTQRDTERAGLVEGKQTNNIAEALALYHALSWAAEKGYKKIKLYSDSQITLNNMKKAPHLIKANTDIFKNIAQTITDFQLTVRFEKVLGHSGNVYNERADVLANTLAGKGSAA